jgi:pimeloyl-ACP methyl ester carboxylesterase
MPRATTFLTLAAATLWSGCASLPPSELPSANATVDETELSGPDWAALADERLPLLAPCQVANVEETLLCGTIEVAENRALAEGRRIELNVVVVPAQRADPPSDAVFVFEGGPGGAVTQRAVGLVWAGPVRQRDIVLVDQRGTGASHPIDCDLGGGTTDRLGELREMFPPADVAACARELSTRADLTLYTSAEHAADIEEVRQRLGYDGIHLRGGSYGTDAIMVYAQRYPQTARSLFGIGVDSPLRSNLAERGVWSDRVLAEISELCASDADCGALVPDLDRTLRDLLAGLDTGPRRVELADPVVADERLTLDVSRDWLTEQLRLNLYYAFTSRALPWAVYRAHSKDDWEPLVQLGVLIQRLFKSALSAGVLLTVQCSEGMNFDVDLALERGSKTLFGNYRLEQQIQGCAAWPHEKKPTLTVAEPESLDTPTIWVSGALDPVTPPAYAEDAREYFPNSLHLVLPEGQHGVFDLENGWQCIHQIWADLLDSGKVEGLDTSCTETMHRAPFIVDGETFAGHVAEVLASLTQ